MNKNIRSLKPVSASPIHSVHGNSIVKSKMAMRFLFQLSTDSVIMNFKELLCAYIKL